jgi:hypothetical protein
MSHLNFSPKVFSVTTTSGANPSTWDLLTLDGSAPNETIYFLAKGDSPSFNQQDEIATAIENEDWVEGSITDEDVIINYDIDVTVFDASGAAYGSIVERLNELQSNY